MKDSILDKNFLKIFFPWKTLFVLAGVWVVLAVLNYASLHYGVFTGADVLFPFSVIYPSSFLWSGFLFAFTFLFFGYFIYPKINKLSFVQVFFSCLLLVFLGNMAQGNMDIAFEQPFYLKGRQYYADAIQITDAGKWLSDFNVNQGIYQLHTNTHPPFITLFHYFVLNLVAGSVLGLGIVFFLLSSLFFLILKSILFNLGFAKERIKEILIFSAIIPSVNIYLLVSIDGLILASSSLILLGVTRILKNGKIDFLSVLFCFLSIFITNIFSFSGLFLLAFFGLYSLLMIFRKNNELFSVFFISVALNVIVFIIIYQFWGYNHVQAFFKASASENPGGFMLFHNSYIYFWTRLQAIGEILIFLSVGFATLFFAQRRFRAELFLAYNERGLFFCGIISLFLMFASGAYGTGETARACLFIVPFFLLLLKNINKNTFQVIYLLGLFQTFFMQLIGNYYW